jgi:hypothetical protein
MSCVKALCRGACTCRVRCRLPAVQTRGASCMVGHAGSHARWRLTAAVVNHTLYDGRSSLKDTLHSAVPKKGPLGLPSTAGMQECRNAGLGGWLVRGLPGAAGSAQVFVGGPSSSSVPNPTRRIMVWYTPLCVANQIKGVSSIRAASCCWLSNFKFGPPPISPPFKTDSPALL